MPVQTHIKPANQAQNLTHRITRELGIAIVTGAHSRDNPIPSEAELSRRYDLSRSVVREAVKMLTAKGLLSSRPRTGITVQSEDRWNLLDPDVLAWHLERPFSKALLMEFTDLRLSIEPAAAALAARVAGAADKTSIRTAMDRLHAADRGDGDKVESNIAFHVCVLHACQNGFFAQFAGLTTTALRFSSRAPARSISVRRPPLMDHQRVANAIIASRPGLAEQAMRSLIQDSVDVLGRHPIQGGRGD
jgi:DNA-binding FadR family transcriptional regulator